MSNKRLTILVLGVGGNVSQGILKALAVSDLDCRVIGACVSPLSAGLYLVDKAYVSPQANDPGFIEWLVKICQVEEVQGIFSGVEPVLAQLAKHRELIKERTGAISIVASSEQLAIGNDKLMTCQWLEQQGLNFPHYAAADDELACAQLVTDCGYPLFAKPRFGKGSQGLITVTNAVDLAWARAQTDYVVQEYLGTADLEFTASCFCDSTGRVCGTIVMKRELLAGTTYRAEIGEFPAIKCEAERIATALKPKGSCNMQFRVVDGRPVCFEINLRFSGTTPMRAHFGFNEVAAAVRHYVCGEPLVDLPIVTTGVALRYWNEIYPDMRAVANLKETGVLELTPATKTRVEDFGYRV